MDLEATLARKDIARAKCAWYFRTTFGRVATALWVVSAVATIVGAAIDRPDVLLSWRPLLIILTLLPLAMAVGGLNSSGVRRLLEAPVVYSFTAAGVQVTLARASAQFAWAEVKTAFESTNYVVLVCGGSLQILPKRVIAPLQLAELREVLRNALGKRARLVA